MPLSGHRVLIVEDEAVIALDLALAVEEANGSVVGPAESVRQALALVDDAAEPVTGAVLDITVRDGEVTPVARRLQERGIPFVVHTGGGLPPRLRGHFPHDVTVFIKPTPTPRVVGGLAAMLADGARPAP